MVGKIGDLTTLANVKAWRSPPITTVSDDTALQREITACSKFLLNTIQRRLITQSYTEVRNGTGQCALTLRNRPLISVSSVAIGQSTVPIVNPLSPGSCGFSWDSNPDPVFNTGTLYVNGWDFCEGFQNVKVVYVAGYLVQSEAQTIGAGGTANQIQCSALFELLSADYLVTYKDTGVALVPVPGTPSVGQYNPPLGPDGFYVFNAGETDTNLLISYSYTPKDLEAACITTVILEYNRRNRIGEDNKVLAGETVIYSKSALADPVKDILRNYQDVSLMGP